MLAEVLDESADLKPLDGLALGGLNQPLVYVELGLPVRLVHHHRPSLDELVVHDLYAVRVILLQVDLPTDGDAIHFHIQALLVDVPLNLFGFQLAMHERPKLRGEHRGNVNFYLTIVLFAQPSNFWWRHKLSHAILGCAFCIEVASQQSYNWRG